MKKIVTLKFVFLLFACFCADALSAQQDSLKTYIVMKHDKTEFIGKILSQDAREVLIETKEMGQIIIPKHEIRSIKEVKPEEMTVAGYVPAEVFSTRYFL